MRMCQLMQKLLLYDLDDEHINLSVINDFKVVIKKHGGGVVEKTSFIT